MASPLMVMLALLGSAACLRKDDADNSQQEPPRIPHQLVLTGRPSTLDGLAPAVKTNLQRALATNPGLVTRYLSDADCEAYVETNFGEALLAVFQEQTEGKFRGDICRAAVLHREGGFYMDLDVQPEVPLLSLAGGASFLATREAPRPEAARGLLNAFMAAAPESPILSETLAAILDWDKTEGVGKAMLGPWTLGKGLSTMMEQQCPEQAGELTPLMSCGGEVIKLLFEEKIQCGGGKTWLHDSAECPASRVNSPFYGAKFAIFESPRRVVAWSRFDGCDGYGCGTGGSEAVQQLHVQRQ